MAQTTAYTSFGPVSLIAGLLPSLIDQQTYSTLVRNKKHVRKKKHVHKAQTTRLTCRLGPFLSPLPALALLILKKH
jgi:hypothetical protein